MTREEAIKQLHRLKADIINGLAFVSKTKDKHLALESLDMAIASLETDEAYQLEYELTKNDLAVDFKLKDYVSREAVRRIIKSPRTQEQMLNALNSLRNATECKAEDCINRDYTAKYVEEFANNEYVSQDEAETIYLIADGIRHIPSALPDVPDNNVGNIDCISRADAIGSIAVECSAEKQDIDYAKFLMLRRAIKALPTVAPIRPKGHWISHREHCEMNNLRPSGLGSYFWCSECDCGIDSKDFARVNYNYCPNCGAKMVESQKSEG